MTAKIYNSLRVNAKDYVMIVLGILIYSTGFTVFILPHHVVIGGLTGVGTLVNFATGGRIPVAVTIYVCNILLLAGGYKLLGRRFVLRTIFGATVTSLLIGALEGYFSTHQPILPDTAMSVILGGILSGIGIGIVFVHNGSSGGTDIVAAMVSKVSNVSIGRTMMIVDMTIVASSLILPFDGDMEARLQARVPLVIYGWVVTFMISYFTDQLINGNRQAKQFIIISPKWKEIADLIITEAHRGVTVLDGEGWYSHGEVKVLMVWCRKIESVGIFRIVKSVDEHAIITQSNVNGVYGKGFDIMRIKMKKQTDVKK
jgi:uncharacterized membrane-anchored protein YitT (DUF2179 family)